MIIKGWYYSGKVELIESILQEKSSVQPNFVTLSLKYIIANTVNNHNFETVRSEQTQLPR